MLELKDYAQTLSALKKRIQEAQTRAAISVNHELIKLYWDIGMTIAEKQENSGWGTGVIETLAKDLQNAFPGLKGFSRSNVFFMRSFYKTYEKVQQPARLFDFPIFNIPWWHNILLLTKLKENIQRLWYAQKIIERGWSRRELEDWIESNLYSREGKAISNFSLRLPNEQAKVAQEMLKDPYNFDFLSLGAKFHERELETRLVEQIQKTLIEFGHGFAFVGRQYPLEVDGQTFYIDLLFYHIPSHRYLAVELKAEDFKPEHTGQMNFYLAVLDDKVKTELDFPSIGLILCKKKSKFVAEYSLRHINNLMAVSGYGNEAVEELLLSLPSVEEIEAELDKEYYFKNSTLPVARS